MERVPLLPSSTKEQIVRVAERLFAARGLDGVSLREIGVAAGNANNSVVQYHFGTKEQLVLAIFEFRLPNLEERRKLLFAARQPNDLRSWLECYVLPILEHSEMEESHYLSFIAMLQQHARRDLFERIPGESLKGTQVFLEQVGDLLPHLPEPLRTHRLAQALTFSIHAGSDRERVQANGQKVLPFAVYVTDLLDGLVGFLEAPFSSSSMTILEGANFLWPMFL